MSDNSLYRLKAVTDQMTAELFEDGRSEKLVPPPEWYSNAFMVMWGIALGGIWSLYRRTYLFGALCIGVAISIYVACFFYRRWQIRQYLLSLTPEQIEELFKKT